MSATHPRRDAYLARERELAALDLTLDPSWRADGRDPAWLKGPRVLICDLRVGAKVRNIDGQTMTIKRHDDNGNGPTWVMIGGFETCVIQACAVIEVSP